MEQAKSPSPEGLDSQYSMTSRRSPQTGQGPKSGVTNPLAPAPASSDKIEEINRRFDTFACTGETFGDLKAKVYRHEAEMVELRRQVELSPGTLAPTQPAGGK